MSFPCKSRCTTTFVADIKLQFDVTGLSFTMLPLCVWFDTDSIEDITAVIELLRRDFNVSSTTSFDVAERITSTTPGKGIIKESQVMFSFTVF